LPLGAIEKKKGQKNVTGQVVLVGGFNHLEKYESQWEGLLFHINKKCLKPPTSIYILCMA
jgi:hypothetical protein